MGRNEKDRALKHPGGSIYADGYGTVAKMVMQDGKLSIEAKAIYAYLCSFMGAGDTAFPSVKKMCYDLKIGEGRFYKHMGLLVDQNYIRRVQSVWAETKTFTNNDYILVLKK